MENRKKHTAKTNKITSPFYSLPTRHYGQTPSEIIREARASLMTMPTPDVKPIFTNRPFTPKEKERTLFGNVKKRISRPPSAFSLSYLKEQDDLQRIKLPTIGITSQKKVTNDFKDRTIQSLDNLIEEYETEILQEQVEIVQQDLHCLPYFRNTHSSCDERKMIRTFSLNNKIPDKSPIKRNIYTISQKCTQNTVPCIADFYEHSKIIKQRESDFHDDSLQKKGERAYDLCSMNKEFPFEKVFLVDNENKFNQEVRINETKQAPISTNIPDATESYYRDVEKDKVENIFQTNNFENNLNDIFLKKEEIDNISNHLTTVVMNREAAEINENKSEKEIEDTKILTTNINISEIKLDICDKSINIDAHKKSSTEKSTETELRSDYLIMLCNPPSDRVKSHYEKSKEILELYNTAEYYGVILNDDGDIKYNEKKDKKYHEIEIKSPKKEEVHRKSINEDHNFIKTEDKPQIVGWDGFWKNSYYLNEGETEKLSSLEKNKFKNLDQFVVRLITVNKNNYEHREIANILNEMYKYMKEENIFHNNVINQEAKINILKCLYNFANNEDPEILLNMARIVFGLRIENSLSAACKMAFKVARSDANDYLFLQMDDILELLLQGIGLSSPLDAPESCIYGYGALKFLTMNHQILSRLTNLGILDLLILHLKMINSAKLEGLNVNEQTQHALFQLTGALRNFAAGDGVLPLFITTNSIPVICKILDNFRHCEDLVINISRTLSLLSADENMIHIFMSFDNILEMLIELMEIYKLNDKILIRLAYCLGNIVAYNDLARVLLSRYESSVTVLVKTLQLYADKDLELSMKQEPKATTDGDDADTTDDVIVKLIRIIANMCMNPVVGSNLSPANGKEKNSLHLTQLLTILLKRKDPGTTLLACLGCLNNISYYSNNHSSLVDITEGIIRVLGLPDEECQAEAARVLGNLTRHKEIRDVIFNIGGMDQLLKLLNSKDKEVFRSTCGALVNLMLDSETRKLFIETHGIDKLVAGLENFSGDWLFAGLICRAIWNSCADHMERVTSHNNVEKLVNFLTNSLDEENEKNGDAAWDEFAILATDLLEKINNHFESI